jgi:hypothetical protein
MTGQTLLDYPAAGVVVGAQLVGGQSETVARTPQLAQNSGPIPAMPALRRRLDVPIYLQPAMTYSMKLIFPRPVQLLTLTQGGKGGFKIRIDMWGVETFKKQG